MPVNHNEIEKRLWDAADELRANFASDARGSELEIRKKLIAASKGVNKELISLYWDIGRMIVERQKGKTWGKAVVERLAKDLQTEFPGIQGFSAASLWRMKHFYETDANKEKLAPLVREIGWTYNLIVEYALRESSTPIGVAAYRVVSKLPRELRGQLPSPEQVAKLLEGIQS